MRNGGILGRLKALFKSKFFIILMAVAVFLTVLPVTLSAMGRSDIVRSGANLIAYPFRALATATGKAFSGFSDYFTDLRQLKEENERLQKELDEANSRLDSAQVAEAENEWLKQFIVFTLENTNYKLIDAITVSRDSGELVTGFTLNKGSSHGIKKGMPVMSETGLVGYVSEVGLNYAHVRSIICDDTSAGVVCPRSAAYGVIEGNYSFFTGENGLCKMICSDGKADIKVGDTVVTSGSGSIYPYGLPVGRVISVEVNEYTRALTAYIEPYHSFELSGRVMVVSVGGVE